MNHDPSDRARIAVIEDDEAVLAALTFALSAEGYGVAGFEFYQHAFFTLAGDVWQPEEPAERLSTVRWT